METRDSSRETDADREAARITRAIAVHRRAAAAGVLTWFGVATAAFFGFGYGFPDAELGFGALAASLGLGAFCGVAVWTIARARTPVFDRLSSTPDAPADAETRALEDRARRHEARNRLALAVAAIVFFAVAGGGLVAWSAHLDALNETREYWSRESLGIGDVTLALGSALALAALAWWLLRAKVDVLLELGGVAPTSAPGADAPVSAEDLSELRRIGDEVRRAQRREALGRVGATIAGVGTASAVLFVIDRAYEAANGASRYGDDLLRIGGSELLVSCGLGAAAALLVTRIADREQPAETPASATERRGDDRDWFAETLETTGALTLRAPGDLGSLIARFFGVATNRWSLLDGGGAAFCEAAEIDLPLAQRWVPLRGRTIEIRDLDRTPMRLVRRAGWAGAWEIVAEGVAIGSASAGLFGAIVLRDRAGHERLRARRSWWNRRRHVVTRDGAELTRIVRARRSLFASVLEDASGSRIELPGEATLDDRRLLLAAALLVDLDRA
ncbi:MAG: hypothetical protein M3Y87_13575 [Myxococcota bacterium]|nr:hypothetical protein [Myxococcota bacterium]